MKSDKTDNRSSLNDELSILSYQKNQSPVVTVKINQRNVNLVNCQTKCMTDKHDSTILQRANRQGCSTETYPAEVLLSLVVSVFPLLKVGNSSEKVMKVNHYSSGTPGSDLKM